MKSGRSAASPDKEQSMSTTTPTVIPTGTWTVDPAHSRVGFAVKHMGIATVRGEFTEFEGTLEIGEDLASAKVYGTVKVQSVDTNEPERDEHLRSADFFDAAQFPELRFESTKIEALDHEEFRITGNLTIRRVTNEIVLHAEAQGTDTDPWGNERVGLEVTGQLSRGDYGMKFNQALGSGNVLVADKVKLALDISAVKQA
jgi:polyisoprenoid-binding protein YceI